MSHHRNLRTRRLALLGALALTGTLVGAAGTAQAVTPTAQVVPPLPSLTGVVTAALESAEDSRASKSVTVACPGTTRVINAGGYLTGADGQVTMDDLFANEALTEVTVTGKETDAFAGTWRVKAFATCADAPAGLEWNSSESVEDSDDDKSALAECTPGKTLLGTGATIRGGRGEAIVDEIAPNGGAGSPADQVRVRAYEPDTYAGDWAVSALAICADPLAGQQVLHESTGLGSVNNGVHAECDPGQVATGGAAEIFGAIGEVVIDDVFPTDGSTTTAPTATTVYGQEEDPTVAQWSIRAYVLCADA